MIGSVISMCLAAAPAVTVEAKVAPVPERIAFEQAVQKAIEHNPQVRVAKADADRADALVEQARAPSLPTLNLNGQYTRLEGDRGLNGNVLQAANQLAANAQLNVPIIVPARWANWRRASVNADAAKTQALDTRRLVALAAARAWLSVLAQQRVVQAQQRGVDAALAHLQYAEDRRKGGIGSKLDELRASQEAGVARTQLATARAQLERLQEQLGTIVGVDSPLDVIDAEPHLNAPPDEAAALKLAPESRNDLLAAKQRVDAAQTGVDWYWADFVPFVTGLVQPGLQNPATITQPNPNFQAVFLISLPLYDGGLRYGQQKERRANLLTAQAQLENASRQANADVRAAVKVMGRADEGLESARGAASDAAQALVLAQEAFRAGGSTNIEVIDAERRARDAETAQAVSEDTARQARLELLGASGQFPQQ